MWGQAREGIFIVTKGRGRGNSVRNVRRFSGESLMRKAERAGRHIRRRFCSAAWERGFWRWDRASLRGRRCTLGADAEPFGFGGLAHDFEEKMAFGAAAVLAPRLEQEEKFLHGFARLDEGLRAEAVFARILRRDGGLWA